MDKFKTQPLRFRVWDKEQSSFLTSTDDDGVEREIMGLRDVAELIDWAGEDNVIVSQDTGFKDSDRYPIFTGDILQDDGDYLSIVQYRDGEIVTVSLDGEQVIDSLSAVALYSTVIGSIWSKSDLLEGAKND